MDSNFLPQLSLEKLNEAYTSQNYDELYDLLAQPLHIEMYQRNSFDFLDDLSPGQQLLLGYDYVRMQVGQGGFIQFIENGYISLLPAMIEQLISVGAPEMAKVFDDVLKVFVLNNELLNKPTTVQEFAQLYDELKEFEIIDERFHLLNKDTIKIMLDYAMSNLGQFVSIP
jgi:hypothetical protein